MKLSQKKTYNISVHQFVEIISVGGDLTTGSVSTVRMQQGVQAHIRRQQEQNKISEFPLDYVIEGVNVKICIRGKADIIDKSGKIDVIEEIKTIFSGINKNTSVKNEHLAQCKCYCAMYVIKTRLQRIIARVAYVEHESTKVKIYEYNYTEDEILDWFKEKTDYILKIFESRQEHINKRDLSSREIKFPFNKYRIGQKEMATYVYKGCRSRIVQFLQAPTGIGKTMGTIYPSIKAFAHEGYEKIFYATAKNTIKKIAEDAIDILRSNGLVVNSITLTAKETSCPQKIFNCHPKVCARAKGYYDRVGLAMDCFEENKHYGLEEAREIADRFNICPFEFLLDISTESDIIICDYNNIYDPRAKLKRFFDDGGDYAILTDEAHNLVNRARGMYSGEIDKEAYTNLSHKMSQVRSKRGKDVLDYLDKIIRFLNSQFKEMERSDIAYEVLQNPLDKLNKLLEKFLEAAEAIIDTSTVRQYTKDLLEVFYQTKGYLLTVGKADENYVHYIAIEGKNIRIKMFCIDPSQRLQDCHDKSKSSIFFSASLTPFKYYTRLLQRTNEYKTHELASPFYKENLKILVNANLPVEYKHRDKHVKELVENVYTFVKGKRGKYLIFFPSYRYMEKAHNLFISLYDDVFAPKQERSMDADKREAFISLFNEDSHMAAFAVMGGVFSEGIDLKGEKLIGAVVVGTGFPMMSLENNFIRDFHDNKEEEGLGYAYIYPGFNKVVQAVGRVIRSEKDRGAVLLIDKRFARKEYQDLMPEWWKPVEYVGNTEGINSTLSMFWSGKDE